MININRILWLDSSRGLAFLMVIYAHIHCFNNEGILMPYFGPMFLTTFFFVSGYLFKKDQSFIQVLENKTRTLFIPQFLFGLYQIGLQQFFTTRDDVLPLKTFVLQLFWHNTGDNHGLWFVAALYAYSLVFYFLLRNFKTSLSLLISSSTLFILNWIYYYLLDGEKLPWYLHFCGFGCFYMALGKIYKERLETLLDKYVQNKILVLLILAYIIIISVYHGFNFYSSPLFIDQLIISIWGVCVLVYISKLYVNNRIVLYIGANSLLYFGFHHKPISIISILIKKIYERGIIMHTMVFDELFRIIMVLIIALIVIIPVFITSRWFPWVTGKGYVLWKTNK